MVRRSTTEWLVGDDRFIEVMHGLTHPEEQWSYPERPDILTSLDELAAWASDTRTYDDRIHKSGWASAINDFFVAADSLGSHVLHAVKPHVDAIRTIRHSGIGGNQRLRTQLSAETAAMRQVLADTDTLVAAWTDFRRSCSRKETSMNTVAARRDTFWAVVRATDRNTTELSRAIRDVLTGDLVAVTFAKLKLGEIDNRGVDFQLLRDTPPVGALERLELAEKLLRTEPAKKHHVVWFAFRSAYSSPINQQLNSIQLFDAQWLHGNLFGDGPFKDQLPSELHKLDHPNSIPDHRDVVLARVDLGVGVFSNAIRVAGEQIDALLGIATIGSRIPWERMPGFIHALDGRIASEERFEYEERKFQSPDAMHETAGRIGHMAPRIAPILPVQDSDVRHIIDALHWWRADRDQPTAASIVLNVRAIELIASRLGESNWTTYLEKYMKHVWMYSTIVDTLLFPLHEALLHPVSSEAQTIQRELFLEAFTYKHGQQGFDVNKAAARLDTIIQFTPPNLPVGRQLRTIKKRTSSTAAMQDWSTELEKLWAGSVHRLERVRNSIAHGGPFTERAIQLAHPFSRRLSIWALRACLTWP